MFGRFLALGVAAVAISGLTALAQDALPPGAIKPRRSDCQVTPISDDTLAAARQRQQALIATPIAVLQLDEVDDPLAADELAESDLPPGIPADAETIAAITDLELEFVACLNAGELRRAAALLTGDLQAIFLAYAEAPELVGDRLAPPSPMPKDERIPYVIARDVRRFPDGRVGAVVDWGSERFFGLYEWVDGRWLSSDEIRIHD